jgi:hypothetical protein
MRHRPGYGAVAGAALQKSHTHAATMQFQERVG